MFLFWKEKKAKQSQPRRHQKLQKLIIFTQESLQKTKVTPFYNWVLQNINKSWPTLTQKYEKQLIRIKKSQVYWNYSDLQILRNCIKKSLQTQILSIFIPKWCEFLSIFLLQPMLEISTNNSSRHLSQNQKRKLIGQEIYVFCEYLFKLSFEIYQDFFKKYYKKSNSKLNREQIYKKQRQVFQDFIRNILTCLPQFEYIYKDNLSKILTFNWSRLAYQKIKTSFSEFLYKQLNISTSYQKIYINTAKKIFDFHATCNIQQKLHKITQIIPAIEQDHIKYYEENKLPIISQKQTKTTEILHYLFAVYCPQISSSFNYIKLILCYRNQNNNTSWQQTLSDFCFLWLHENTQSKIMVVFDAIQDE